MVCIVKARDGDEQVKSARRIATFNKLIYVQIIQISMVSTVLACTSE